MRAPAQKFLVRVAEKSAPVARLAGFGGKQLKGTGAE